MDFFRRAEKRATPFDHARILVPLLGDDEVDDPGAQGRRAAARRPRGRRGLAAPRHRGPVRPQPRRGGRGRRWPRADEILSRAEALLSERGIPARTSTVQARAAGPAIVDDANELGADLIVMGLRYKKRFGGQWDAGRTVPYVMRNSTAPVWCLRAETKELAHTP